MTILFSVMFSSPSLSEWKKVSGTVDGQTMYLDVDRIKTIGEYSYWWELMDFHKPDKWGNL